MRMPPISDSIDLFSNLITIIKSFSTVIRRIQNFYIFASVFSVAAGMILSHYKQYELATTLTTIGVIALAVVNYFQREQSKSRVCVNPDLVIEHDSLNIIVKKNSRTVNQTVHFKARRLVTDYHFKFWWTASNQKVTVESDDGILLREYAPYSKVHPWQPYILRFFQPLKPNQIKTVVLNYTLLNNQDAFPYHTTSYAHVHHCKKIRYAVSFEEGMEPHAFFFVEFDDRGVPFKTTRIPFNAGANAYIIDRELQLGWKFALEWDM